MVMAVAKERQVGAVTVLELSGRVTIGVGNGLDEKLQSLIANGRLALLLDCRHVIALDSWGMRAIVRGLVSARKHGGDLKLLRISPQARQVLDFSRLLTVFETYDDE